MIPSGKPHNEMILPDFADDIGDIIDAKGRSAGLAMRIATLIFGLMLAFGAAAVALGDERLAIPASRFSMAVPELFSVGQGFAGYEDLATKSRILIVEFPPGMAASSYKDFKPLFDDLFIANSNFARSGRDVRPQGHDHHEGR